MAFHEVERGRRLPKVLDTKEIAAMIGRPVCRGLKQTRNRAILITLWMTGLRVGELCKMKLSDVPPTPGPFRIIGKGDKERMVYLVKPAWDAIQVWLANRPKVDSDALWLNRLGTPMDRRSVQRMVVDRGREVLGKHVTPHMFRHSFATQMHEKGVDLRVIQELLGHASLDTTMIYTHMATSRMQSIVETLHPGMAAVKA